MLATHDVQWAIASIFIYLGCSPTTRGRVSGQAGGVMSPRTSKIPLCLADSNILHFVLTGFGMCVCGYEKDGIPLHHR